MAEPSNSDPVLEQADRAAEALARSSKESIRPEIDPAREQALDNAFAEVSGTAPAGDAQTDPNQFGRENGGVRPPVEGTPAEETTPAAETKPAETPAPAAETKPAAEEPKTKTLLDELIPDATKPAETKPSTTEDPYNVKLRSDASPKTRETVEQLKTIAREREAAALKQAEEARAQVAEKEARIKELEAKTVPDEVQNELKELRQFRAQFDAERDPEFRQRFDSKVETNYSAIYAKLQQHGLPASEIEKLKGFSQSERDTAIERLASKLSGLDRRTVEAKLLDNVNIAEERQKALEDTRRKADEILKQKSQAPAEQAQKRVQEIATLVQPELARLPWIHAKEIPATAAPEEKKRLEADNARALELQEQLKTAIVDDSPVARARAALSVPLARHFSTAYAAEKARADALQAKLDAINQAGATSRTARTSAAVAATRAPDPNAKPKEAGDAIDDLFFAANASR
jgi:hypothetical protein